MHILVDLSCCPGLLLRGSALQLCLRKEIIIIIKYKVDTMSATEKHLKFGQSNAGLVTGLSDSPSYGNGSTK